MYKLGLAALAATVSAEKFSWGSCGSVDWEPLTDGQRYDGMNDTFI